MWYTDLEACVDARATGHRGERAVSLLYNISKPTFDEQFFFSLPFLHLQSSSSNLLLPHHPVVSSTSRLPLSIWVNHCNYIVYDKTIQRETGTREHMF